MRWVAGSLLGVILLLAAWALGNGAAPAPPPVATAPDASVGAATEARGMPATGPAVRAAAADDSLWLQQMGAEEPGPTAAPAEDASAAVLRGRLTVRQRPWVHPAGVEIRLTRQWLDTVLPTEAPPTAAREPVATTAADGSFAFRFHPGAGELFFLIDRGGAWLDYQKVPRVPPSGAASDLGDVLVDDRGGVRGLVLDRDGKPVAGATVRAVDATLTDVTSGLADHQSARVRGTELFDADGATDWGPLPRWVARRDLLLPFPSTTSDADGAFVLQGLRPGTHELFVQHEAGSASLHGIQVAALRSTEVGSIRLHDCFAVDLGFLGDDGLPWVDASVAFLHDEWGYGSAAVRTDARGRVRAMVTDPAGTRLVFTYPGDGPCLDLGPTIATGPVVVVARVPKVRVSLADVAGVALTGGRVRLFATGVQFRPIDRRLPDWMQPTELQPGVYVGRGLAGTVAVASVPGYAPAMAPLHAGDNTLTLLPLQHVTVRVHDRDGRAIAGATVRLQVHQHQDLDFPGTQWELLASDRVRAGRTDEQGLLTVPVWGTWFSFEASQPDYANSAGPRLVPRPGATIDLLLQRRASIQGTLTTQHRPATAGFRVRARQRPPAGNQLDGSGFLAEQLAVTAADGSFAFRDLCAGMWELQPEFPAIPGTRGAVRPATTFASQQVLLDEGQELHTILEASRATMTTPQLAGVVRGNGAPIAGAVVRVRTVAEPQQETRPRLRRQRRAMRPQPEVRTEVAPWLQQCTTDSFGGFDFGCLAPAQGYEVRVDLPQDGRLQLLESRIVVTPPTENAPATRVDFDLATGSVVLQCSQTGLPLASRMLRLRQVRESGLPGASFDLLTDQLGSLTAEGLPAGRWTVEPIHGGSLVPDRIEVRARTITATTAEYAP